jgi:hypothetical protein
MASVPVPDEATWFALREAHVGGSDISSLFYSYLLEDGTEAVLHMYEMPPKGAQCLGCLSPHTTGYRLWQEKMGRLMPDDLGNVERVQAGVHLEPALATWAAKRWDWKLRKVRRYCKHDLIYGWGASLDYEEASGDMAPVEFKNVDGLMFKNGWVTEDNEIIMPPLNYVLQLQHQIGAVNASYGWIVACIGGNQLMRGRIARHEPTQARIAAAVNSFWIGVDCQIEPTWVADYDTVADAYRYGNAGVITDLTADETVPVLCEQYLAAKEALKEIEQQVDLLKGQIAAKVGEGNKATANGYRLSWPIIERAEKMIPERIQKSLTYRGGLTITPLKEV